MKKTNIKSKTSLALGVAVVSLVSLTLGACGSSSSDSDVGMDGMKTYKVTIKNVTANQPLSHAAVILHQPSYHAFQAGSAASVGIERLAEGGRTSVLLDEASADAAHLASKSGSSEIAPGASSIVSLSVDENATGFNVSVASMLVNTNDAFVGVSSGKVAGLAVGQSFAMHIPVWDAGTEANDELASTIPGPAGGGEGFNDSREGDANFVAIHQGVVTHADGLATSALNETHRFNNPGALLRVERVK